jgi:hypothetical protein
MQTKFIENYMLSLLDMSIRLVSNETRKQRLKVIESKRTKGMLGRGYEGEEWKDNEKRCLVEYNAMTHYLIVGNGPLPNKFGETLFFPFFHSSPLSLPFIFPFSSLNQAYPLFFHMRSMGAG